MKHYLVPLLVSSALLSGCHTVGVRHSAELPVVVSQHRHVDTGVTVVHRYDGGHHAGNHAVHHKVEGHHHAEPPRRVVVRSPQPVIHQTSVTVIEGDRVRLTPHNGHRHTEQRVSGRGGPPASRPPRHPHVERDAHRADHPAHQGRTERGRPEHPRHPLKRTEPRPQHAQRGQSGRPDREASRREPPRNERADAGRTHRGESQQGGGKVKTVKVRPDKGDHGRVDQGRESRDRDNDERKGQRRGRDDDEQGSRHARG